jgi:hypothetical protein
MRLSERIDALETKRRARLYLNDLTDSGWRKLEQLATNGNISSPSTAPGEQPSRHASTGLEHVPTWVLMKWLMDDGYLTLADFRRPKLPR